MENNRSAAVPPYLRSGTPGALKALISVEAVLSALMCVLSVISSVIQLSEGTWTAVFTIALVIYGSYLSIRLFVGVIRLSRGDANGAYMAAGVCHGRFILVWISFALIIVSQLISLGSASYGILAMLLAAGLSLVFILPLSFYYRDAELAMNHVFGEMSVGKASRPLGMGRLSVLCVIFAALLGVLSILLTAGILKLPRYGYSSIVSQLLNLVSIYLYLGAARYLLVNLCFRGFRRSHALCSASEENTSFAPAGYSDSPALCVLGSIVFGWFAIACLSSLIRTTLVWGYSLSALVFLRELFHAAACILFGLALMRHRGRYVMTVVGAGCMHFYCFVLLFLTPSARNNAPLMVYAMMYLLFYVLLAVWALLCKSGKSAPKAVRIALIVLFSIACLFDLLAGVNNSSYLSSIVETLLTMLGGLGLIWKLKEPAPDAPAPMEAEPEKEAVPDQV